MGVLDQMEHYGFGSAVDIELADDLAPWTEAAPTAADAELADRALDHLASLSDDDFDALVGDGELTDAEAEVLAAAQDAARRADFAVQQVDLATARLELHADRQAERFDDELMAAWDRVDGVPRAKPTPARGPRPTMSGVELANMIGYDAPDDIESMSEIELAQWYSDQQVIDGLLAEAEDVQHGRRAEIDLSEVDDDPSADEAALALWSAQYGE